MTPSGRVAIDESTSPQEAASIVAAWVEEAVPVEWRRAAETGGSDQLRRIRSRESYAAWYPAFAGSGLVVPTWPEEYGGLGVGSSVARAIDEVLRPYALARLNILGLNLAGTTLLAFGTDEQRARFLPPIVRNEETWCQFFSEPGAGSDLASLATRAERDGDDWIVTGQKVWSTWAHESDFGLLLARTNPDVPKREGITYFICPVRAPGVTVRPLRQMTGEADFNETFFDGVRIPDTNRIGPIDEGWKVANATLSGERQMVAGAGGTGGIGRLGGRGIDRLLDAARGRSALPDGGAPAVGPVMRQRLMRLYSADRAMAWTNARVRDNRQAGRPPGPESSVGKLLSTHHNVALQDAWIDLVGALALARPDDDDDTASIVQGFLRSRANTIEGGTSEVQRTILGERVLGLPREPDPHRGLPWRDVPRN